MSRKYQKKIVLQPAITKSSIIFLVLVHHIINIIVVGCQIHYSHYQLPVYRRNLSFILAELMCPSKKMGTVLLFLYKHK